MEKLHAGRRINLIHLLNGAAAFLKRDGHYLLMKRAADKAIAPGVWSGIGGKMEPYEINNPFAACLREIQEETGITQAHIQNLTLRYIVIRQAGQVIRQSYLYFGETDTKTITATQEGALHWIPESALLERTFTQTFEAVLRHYVTMPEEQGRVILGAAENHDGHLFMRWSVLEDYEPLLER